MPHSLPTVSVLMGAYNYEQYVGRAIQSALDQDYPPELLEVVVVNDGSTDGTGDVVQELADRNPGRVRHVRQTNGGYVAATNRALSESRGDMLALLDADDVWLPHKTRTQVDAMLARPELGMIFGNMLVVDANERMLRPGCLPPIGDLPPRMFARTFFQNIATQSSIMMRGSLREHFDPIPDGIPYADWWFTVRCAEFAQVDYIREPVALYREHGSNLTGGVIGERAVREHTKMVAFQLWYLRNLPLDHLWPEELVYVWRGVEDHARRLIHSAESFFATLTEVTDEHRAHAASALSEADRLREVGDVDNEARSVMRALAWDPYRYDVRKRLVETVARARNALQAPDPLRGAREFVVLTDAEDLLAEPDLLLCYAGAVADSPLVTLVIDASRLPRDRAEAELQALVQSSGADTLEDVDMVAVVGEQDPTQRFRMLSGAGVRLRPDGAPASDDGLPLVTATSLGDVKTLAEQCAGRAARESERREFIDAATPGELVPAW